MTVVHDDGPGGPPVENPHADVIRGLREAADFLEAHPDLPKVHGFIHGHVYGRDARPTLEAFAAHDGPEPTETTSYNDVVIGREFSGGVDIELRATVKSLGGIEQPQPKYDYEPVLGERAAA